MIIIKYEYKPELEMFRRVDNRGPSLKVNITEARRIKSMIELGLSPPEIMRRIDFTQNLSMTNLRTIVSNIKEDNLILDGDYPLPKGVIHEYNITDNDDINVRIEKLEADLEEFKRKYESDKKSSDKKGESVWEKLLRKI